MREPGLGFVLPAPMIRNRASTPPRNSVVLLEKLDSGSLARNAANFVIRLHTAMEFQFDALSDDLCSGPEDNLDLIIDEDTARGSVLNSKHNNELERLMQLIPVPPFSMEIVALNFPTTKDNARRSKHKHSSVSSSLHILPPRAILRKRRGLIRGPLPLYRLSAAGTGYFNIRPADTESVGTKCLH